MSVKRIPKIDDKLLGIKVLEAGLLYLIYS